MGKIKKAWPTKDVMDQIYTMKLWGENNDDFYSGIGSHHPEIVNPYIQKVSAFLKSFKTPPIVCDLGCGDFNVGKELVKYTGNYFAVDIVKDLIRYNQKKFILENLEFRCLDISTDDLPSGDIVILRQVLQHLSNLEIQAIVNKLHDFKYLILTEHLPHGEFVPNKDIIAGQGTRLKMNSGVNLLASPFNFNIKREEKLLSVTVDDNHGTIETLIYEIY